MNSDHSIDLSEIPDLMMLGMDDPHGRSDGDRPPTVGQLAARVRELAGRPADWWHLLSFERVGPVRVRLEPADRPEAHRVETWLTTWPPGYHTRVHDHRSIAKVTVVVGGELVEVALTERGATERPLRANRIRVHGSGHLHELANHGPAFAITLHAELGGSAVPGRPVAVSGGASG